MIFVNNVTYDKNEKETDVVSVNEINFHDSNYLKQRLYLEKRRTERSENRFSTILFRVPQRFQSNGISNHDAELSGKLKNILSLICANVRETDAVSFLHDNFIFVLLPDASREQAKDVFKRLKTVILQKRKLRAFAIPLMNKANVRVMTYPSKTAIRSSDNGNNQRKTRNVDLNSIIMNMSKGQTRRQSEASRALPVFHDFNIVGNSLVMSASRNFSMDLIYRIFMKFQLSIKRIVDVIGALFAILVTSPIMIMTGILIKATSPGPVFFKQSRIGYNGKRIKILKFRSMAQNASEKTHQDYVAKLLSNDNNGSLKDENVEDYKNQIDNRVTGIGKFIRKTSIDELPQLFNILFGDMSLVGPRPHPIYEVELYKKWQFRRLLVKPGLTGLSKLKVRCSPDNYDEAMRYDLRYVDHWSLKFDIKIILKTIPHLLLFLKNGAY